MKMSRKLRFVAALFISEHVKIVQSSHKSLPSSLFWMWFSGKVSILEDSALDSFHGQISQQTANNNDDPKMKLMAHDIYKELRLRGYDYGKTFHGILESNNAGNRDVCWVCFAFETFFWSFFSFFLLFHLYIFNNLL